MTFPFLMLFASVSSHEITLAGVVIFMSTTMGLCLSSAQLVDHQPELARSGMISLGITFILLVLFSFPLGPITR